MKFQRFLIVLALFFGLVAGGAALFRGALRTPDLSIPVLAVSAYPIGYFAEVIAGDEVLVDTITPYGVEPHDYEPTVGERRRLERADALVFVGGGFDPWAERLVSSRKGGSMIVRSLVPSSATNEAVIPEDRVLHGEDAHGDEEDHGGSVDPHVWLDPMRAVLVVGELARIMGTLDPAHKTLFDERAHALTARLYALNRSFDQGLSVCGTRAVIVSHNAFGYLAERYQLEMIPIAGLSPEAEATPGTIAQVVEHARTANVHTVFFETIADPRIAETIAREIGGTTKVLNPVENLLPEEATAGADYFTIMEQNLINLREALSCQ